MFPLDLNTFRCFTNELVKISMDAGARATLAGKTGQGQTYLPGGELPSNSPGETNFVPKIAIDLERVKELRDKAKDPTLAALGGAGTGILAGQLITGGRLGGRTGLSRLGFRGFGGIGAGLALAAQQGNKHLDSATDKRRAELPKLAGLTSSSFSPARQLSAGVQTGSFKKMVHVGSELSPVKVAKQRTP